jgi:hypothetical protein
MSSGALRMPGVLARVGGIDISAQAEVPSARRADTPEYVRSMCPEQFT